MAKELKTVLADHGFNLSRFADLVEVNKSTATRWVNSGIPAARLVEVERRTGIPRQKLRPDLFEGMEASQ